MYIPTKQFRDYCEEIISHWIRVKVLHCVDYRTFGYLQKHTGKTFTIRPEVVARYLGISSREVRYSLTRLRDANMICRKKKIGQTYVYDLSDDMAEAREIYRRHWAEKKELELTLPDGSTFKFKFKQFA